MRKETEQTKRYTVCEAHKIGTKVMSSVIRETKSRPQGDATSHPLSQGGCNPRGSSLALRRRQGLPTVALLEEGTKQ